MYGWVSVLKDEAIERVVLDISGVVVMQPRVRFKVGNAARLVVAQVPT